MYRVEVKSEWRESDQGTNQILGNFGVAPSVG